MITICTLLLLFRLVGTDAGAVYAECNNAANVEIFSKPTGGKPVGKVPCGSPLLVLGGDNQWVIVETPDGTVGYVNVKSVTKDNPRRSEKAVSSTPPTVVLRNPDPKHAVEQTVIVPPTIKFNQTGNIGALNRVLSVPSNGIEYGSGIGKAKADSSKTSANSSKIHNLSDKELSPPRIVYEPEAEYTIDARRNGIEGTVVIRAVVGQDGKVHGPVIKKSLGYGLDEQAIKAVQSWLFEPARKNGSPVAVFVDVEVHFRLYSRPPVYAKDELSEYPLRVLIIETHWHDNPYGGALGYGYGDLDVAGSWVGFDYTFSCDSPFNPSQGGEAYQAKWKKPSSRMLLLTAEIGNPQKHRQCELKTTLRDFEYASVNGHTVTYVRDPSGKLKVDQVEAKSRSTPPPELEARPKLSNSDVISMVGSGLSVAVIVAKMSASECRFDTSPEGLRQLKAAHVPDDIVLEMIKR